MRRARKLAEERVRRGVAWLDTHAFFGWQRHLFDVGILPGGKLYVIKRFNSARSGEDVLALALENHRHLAGADGRITTAQLCKHFDSIDFTELGFNEDERVSCKLLDEVWLQALASYARPRWDTAP